ncbi:hypothetical protein HZA55_05800 [Candidatus Poribacteria bacterium]|nr:hypothetical protein [Candidatus Poribacteria bacterium]
MPRLTSEKGIKLSPEYGKGWIESEYISLPGVIQIKDIQPEVINGEGKI